MHIDAVKGLLRALLELMKEMDLQMCANMTILHKSAKPLKKTDLPLKKQVKNLLRDPASRRVIDAKYARVLAQIEKAIEDRELLEILARWKPDGRPM
jgi:hypothetical protein